MWAVFERVPRTLGGFLAWFGGAHGIDFAGFALGQVCRLLCDVGLAVAPPLVLLVQPVVVGNFIATKVSEAVAAAPPTAERLFERSVTTSSRPITFWSESRGARPTFLLLRKWERAAAERQVQQIHRNAASHSDAAMRLVRVIVLCNDIF